VPISGAVIVSTPQKLAVVDVIKGLDLFNALKVPTLAVVLNMAHFDAPDTGKRYFPFGEGGLERIYQVMDRYNIDRKRLFTLPIDSALSSAGDNGVPEVVSNPSSSTSAIYARLAVAVATGVDERLFSRQVAGEGSSSSSSSIASAVSVKYDSTSKKLILRSIDENGAREMRLDPARVRKSCRCAACVDELTGTQRLDVNSIRPDISVISIKEQGNYAVQIVWSDGHASGIFTYDQLQKLASDQ
jgi:ATP-binding protein involved in chromosome partitioning